jgi:predicted acetyltransferase
MTETISESTFFLRQFGSIKLQDDELVLEPIEVAPHPVHKVPTYFFKMVHADSGEELGRINLRAGSSPHIELYAGYIGYAVEAVHRGHRYAARALRLLMPLASQFGIEPLWISCDPENIASRRTCELAGGEFVEIVDVPATCIIYQSGHPKKCRYRLITRSQPGGSVRALDKQSEPTKHVDEGIKSF